MKIFQDKGKTILPRVDSILLLSRFLVILGVISTAIFQDIGNQEKITLLSFSALFGVFLAIFGYLIRSGRYNFKKPYLAVIIFELFMIPILISLTGYYNSNFYIFYYLTVSFAAYMLTFPVSLVILSIISVSYMLLGVSDLFSYSAANIILRIGFMWFLSLTITFGSDYIRRSERRLLKLFDTLNKRTSELEKSQAHLEMTYENTRVLAGILDVEGVIKEVVRILSQVMGYPASSLLLVGPAGNLIYRGRNISGQSNFNLKAADPDVNELLYRVYRQNEPVNIADIGGRDDYRPLRVVTRSVLMIPMVAHGKVMGVLIAESSQVGAYGEKNYKMLEIVARGAALALENAMLHKKMEELTITDELTGIYNYRYFTQKLREEQKRAARYDLPLSLIMVDIDWFKKFNDTYGHEVGNIVLRGITSVIKKCIRDVDIFCRYGGEEFVVILPQTPQIEVSGIGERIRNQVENTSFGGGGGIPKLKVTVSVGVTSYPENGKTEDEILSVADNALYRAKGAGKNVVCVI